MKLLHRQRSLLATAAGVLFIAVPVMAKEKAAAEKAHALAPPAPFPVGMVLTLKSENDMPAMKTKMSGAQTGEGVTTSHESRTEILTVSAPDKFRLVLTECEQKRGMVADGKPAPVPLRPSPVKDIPLEMVRKGAQWSRTLEGGGALSKEQEADAARFQIINLIEPVVDLALYGSAPRKPGDKWNVDPATTRAYMGISRPQGAMSVEFVGVEKSGGLQCAKLKIVFDLTGKAPNGMAMTAKGEAVVYQSLDYRIFVRNRTAVHMRMERETGPGMTMEMDGDTTVGFEVSVKTP